MTESLPDIRDIPLDLHPPAMQEGPPAPGRRVRQAAPEYAGTRVYHTVYLPPTWRPGRTYPVIVEYAGNGPYRNDFGDTCSGRIEDCNLGFGLADLYECIWVCLPYVSEDGQHHQRQWWGDVEATVEYCCRVVPRLCADAGGDSQTVLLAGFSRGAIACNYLGLRHDRIADLWCGFLCHSHYDGVKTWGYAGDDGEAARERLDRLRGRPQLISHEGTTQPTRDFLSASQVRAPFAFVDLPFRNHTDTWVLRDIPERAALRAWAEPILGRG